MALKPIEEFHDAQAKCKGCFNQRRSLRRVAATHKCIAKLEEMEKATDQREWEALNKAFARAREKARKK